MCSYSGRRVGGRPAAGDNCAVRKIEAGFDSNKLEEITEIRKFVENGGKLEINAIFELTALSLARIIFPEDFEKYIENGTITFSFEMKFLPSYGDGLFLLLYSNYENYLIGKE